MYISYLQEYKKNLEIPAEEYEKLVRAEFNERSCKNEETWKQAEIKICYFAIQGVPVLSGQTLYMYWGFICEEEN